MTRCRLTKLWVWALNYECWIQSVHQFLQNSPEVPRPLASRCRLLRAGGGPQLLSPAEEETDGTLNHFQVRGHSSVWKQRWMRMGVWLNTWIKSIYWGSDWRSRHILCRSIEMSSSRRTMSTTSDPHCCHGDLETRVSSQSDSAQSPGSDRTCFMKPWSHRIIDDIDVSMETTSDDLSSWTY